MTTPELLALIDDTLAEVDSAPAVNAKPMQVIPADSFESLWDNEQVEWAEDGALVPTGGAQ